MNFLTAETISRKFAPRPDLSCSWWLWRRLRRQLLMRGRSCTRESGAFLLGKRQDSGARIRDFVLYDDLDPRALDSGIVHFDGRHFGKLWDLCKERGLTVVADIHVHPGSSEQSISDQMHPMVSQAGHIALILPNYGAGRQSRCEIGMYRYHGRKCWSAVPKADRRQFLHLTLL